MTAVAVEEATNAAMVKEIVIQTKIVLAVLLVEKIIVDNCTVIHQLGILLMTVVCSGTILVRKPQILITYVIHGLLHPESKLKCCLTLLTSKLSNPNSCVRNKSLTFLHDYLSISPHSRNQIQNALYSCRIWRVFYIKYSWYVIQ